MARPGSAEPIATRARGGLGLPRGMSWLSAVGLLIVAAFVLMAVLAPLIAPHDPIQPSLRARLLPPAWIEGGDYSYLLGTDHLGRDLLSRLIHGSRVALIVGFCGVVVAMVIGVTIGLFAGYFGGWIDTLANGVINSILAIPSTLLYLTVLAVYGPSLSVLILTIGCVNWTTFARVVRGEAMALGDREFIAACRTIGQRPWVTLLRHVLPNVLPPIIVIATMNVAMLIIIEASLSFLGFGAPPPTVTWGRMLADGRNYIATSWWLAAFPGLSITLLTLSLIYVGDWLRDRFDPRSAK